MSKSDIVLMVPTIPTEEPSYGPSSGATILQDQMPVSHDDLVQYADQYTGYELDTIELHVKGAAKTGGITQLFVGLSGEAGIKLVLKKKKENSPE